MEDEIRTRVKAIDDGKAVGIPYEQISRKACSFPTWIKNIACRYASRLFAGSQYELMIHAVLRARAGRTGLRFWDEVDRHVSGCVVIMNCRPFAWRLPACKPQCLPVLHALHSP